ncbi:hypothetical protein EYF80_028345 [Liparis tanakae]|uniref:Uncharacterized protein n=1 Tax=Liparis tanakae TaxID=230148 RepID=A0A4Z2H6U3_9TELE|nr:hypothetical protein EYF80_028345 [Liparis tanakae]
MYRRVRTYNPMRMRRYQYAYTEGGDGERTSRRGIVMAMAGIAEDDLDEVMRGEAEDVFFLDGKACQGSVVECESRRGLLGGPRGWTGSLRSPRSDTLTTRTVLQAVLQQPLSAVLALT